MTNEELQAWAVQAWKKEVLKNLPAAKASRSLRASLSQSRKDMARARRSLAASEASSQRKLHQQLAGLEQASREGKEARDREFTEKCWKIVMGGKSAPG